MGVYRRDGQQNNCRISQVFYPNPEKRNQCDQKRFMGAGPRTPTPSHGTNGDAPTADPIRPAWREASRNIRAKNLKEKHANNNIEIYRTAYPYMARHLPWYIDSENPDEENRYYLKQTLVKTSWSKKGKEFLKNG